MKNNRTHKLENPYNRSKFGEDIKKLILKLNNCSYIISSNYRSSNSSFIWRKPKRNNQIISRQPTHNQIISSVDNYHPPFDRRLINMNEEMETQYNILQQVRSLPVTDRIEKLFIEYDNLGNYTNCQWFHSLSQMQLIRLYRCLYDIWIIRGQIPHELKRSICPFHDPFIGIFSNRIYHDVLTYEQIQKACLIVMENMIYSGLNVEYRKIGALHSLTALTMVSIQARHIMPWLYESII